MKEMYFFLYPLFVAIKEIFSGVQYFFYHLIPKDNLSKCLVHNISETKC